jgi:serine/threonine protein kinase
MPYLNNIQKIWITLQILYAVNELAELGIVHGDLKPENILLTSNLSVYLSDIATYKPSYISMDDIGNYTYFFGTNKSDSLKGCYFAPERLLDKGETSGDNNKTFAMDVFSVGVIIAELFLEKNIFDFPQLLNYKKGNKKLFDIEEILVKIPENIRNLINDMIKINPSERITIKDALDRFSNEICPITMTGFLLHFNTLINSTVFWKPDLIIGFIYRYWISLWKMMFGPDDKPAILYQHLNLAIINKIILENPLMQNFFSGKFIKKENSEYLYLKNYRFFFDPDSGKINEKGINELKEKYNLNNNKECVFIIINYLLQNMQNTKYDSTNLVALEMVKELSKKLDDITKLKLIIPYFVENLKRYSYTTKLVSLNFLLDVLYSFDYKELILPVTEYNYFDSYVFPAILEVYKLENHELILEFLNNVDKIIDLEEKFLNLTLKER